MRGGEWQHLTATEHRDQQKSGKKFREFEVRPDRPGITRQGEHDTDEFTGALV